MQNGDEQIDKCVSWQTITTDNQTEKQQIINIHWQNVCLALTKFETDFYCMLLTCQVGKWEEDNTAGTYVTIVCYKTTNESNGFTFRNITVTN